MTRDEILARYRHLRAISTRHHTEVLNFLSRRAILDHARRLGLAEGKALIADSMDELTLAFDLAIYTAKEGQSRAIDRYAKAARLAPGSDEAAILAAMCWSRFSIWRVERPHAVAGLIVRDLLRQSEAWLVDLGLEQSAFEGMALAMRLCEPEAFAMTAGVFVPVDRGMIEEVLDGMLPRVRGEPEQVAEDPRFATAIYRIALAEGVMAQVAFEEPDPSAI
jgi:hypothetical protein